MPSIYLSIYLSTGEGCCMWIKLGIDNTRECEGCGIMCFFVTVIIPTGRAFDSGKKYRYPHTGIGEIYAQSSAHICARKQTKPYPQCSGTWQYQYFLLGASACAVPSSSSIQGISSSLPACQSANPHIIGSLSLPYCTYSGTPMLSRYWGHSKYVQRQS